VLAEVALAARRLPDETYALLASFLAAKPGAFIAVRLIGVSDGWRVPLTSENRDC
jgi:hypothetical protein